MLLISNFNCRKLLNNYTPLVYNGVRHFSGKRGGWRWDLCQRGRRRFVHIDYPPKERSTVVKLAESSDKLMFACAGYIDRIDFTKLSEKAKKIKRFMANSNIPKEMRKLPWKLVKNAVRRTYTPCLAFAQARSHHLIEAFTMEEISALEDHIPEIRKAFADAASKIKEEEEKDRFSSHTSIPLDDLLIYPSTYPPNMLKPLNELNANLLAEKN